ncbi:Copper amine oxidase N-terminal domain-containing protein [Paenibacillus sp. yr247]|uniref:stalk domain-containing protein n=1 Tax=Paenibacillus sp. yr247 TaxID=1761880 RepID=UPI000888F81B|nr:stalk domain-containing protein [Paenibacillus sp. yr247]SDN40974.1 Copper amine oxidase N-terminal domain-containing protein [Paenibacillus sp. yr247]
MKKFILGLACGVLLTASTAVYASGTIQAYLFPVAFEINGHEKKLDSEYTALNFNGHAYVPVRFVAESLGMGVRYINSLESGKVISIMAEPTDADETTKKVWSIQYRLNLGHDEKYVKDLLGQPAVERTNDDHQEAAWRYDIAPAAGYQYEGLTIDIHGLEQGKIGAQLIVFWKEGKVNKIELWYKHTASGKIVTHYVLPDGSTAGAIYE